MRDSREAQKYTYWLVELFFTAWDWIYDKIREWRALRGKK